MNHELKLPYEHIKNLLAILRQIPGGYLYSGICSDQICFPLKKGGELRFSISDDEPDDVLGIDLYAGDLPPGITGPTWKTGE